MRIRILTELAGRAADHGPYRPVTALIEEQVDRTPDRAAVTYDGRTLTYRQFDGLANGLAAELAAAGVRRGDVVPVAVVNSLELPLACFALLKLGAAFVPCDPALPADRLRRALAALGPKVALVQGGVELPAGLAGFRVRADRIAPSADRNSVVSGPEEPVYGIFTSGTTGDPKCAINVHRGLTNRFRFMSRYFAADGREAVLQNSKHTFDSSVWQLFWPLTTGGRTVLPVQGEFLNLEHTIAAIAEHAITMTDFVPGIFNVLVSLVEADPEALKSISSLRNVVVGGEEVNPRAVHRLRELLPDLEVTNGYGPSEASIGMVFHRITAEDGDRVPLGRPIENCYAVVTGAGLALLAPGEVGEIVIGGACVGAGYLGDRGRTAELFVANLFPEIPGDRLYRTGDLGYFDEAGRLCFVGRSDHQVKIDGVRIELGEIEAAAERCPGVRQAKALLARHGDRKSLAVVAACADDVAADALRDQLAAVLPRTSVPRYCFVLSEMPLTDNGKVDRGSLQQLVDRRLAEDAAGLVEVPETGELLGRITGVLRAALGAPGFGVDDDFLRCGGDSLRAVIAALELRLALDVEVGVEDLLDNPVPAELVLVLEERLRSGRRPAEGDEALMDRDAVLPDDLPLPATAATSSFAPAERPTSVLVTGATGFVGSRTVYRLLAQADMQVHCLVRADGPEAARTRVVDELRKQGLWRDDFSVRFHAYPGNLAKPRLGLSADLWTELTSECDAVLHIGALVNFLFDYGAHRAANVLGTVEILRFALTGRPKAVHHVSTLGVLDKEAVRNSNPVSEGFDPTAAAVPTTGYSRSKWVAERLLLEARRRGAPITLYRLGEVMPAADNGYPNRRALSHLLLCAVHRLGVRPATPMQTDYTPVDYVADRLVAGLGDPAVRGRALHVFHSARVDLGGLLATPEVCYPAVPDPEFLARLRHAAASADAPELDTLLALLVRAPAGSSPNPDLAPDAAPDQAPDRAPDPATPSFAALLTDNPRLFRKDECGKLDRRHGLREDPLAESVAAYRAFLAVQAPPLPVGAVAAGPPA
jgi:amino acid adenylation domain-containing protein/thioester reductase-like protein